MNQKHYEDRIAKLVEALTWMVDDSEGMAGGSLENARDVLAAEVGYRAKPDTSAESIAAELFALATGMNRKASGVMR